jgi:hypothetical protein
MLASTLVLALGLAASVQGAAPQSWAEVNTSGFGNRNNTTVPALASFGGQLYAGTYYSGTLGAQLWRQNTDGSWTSVITNGFGNPANNGIDHLLEFNGQLFASTEVDGGTGGEVWRSSEGLNWSPVVTQGFGDSTNGEVFRLTTFNNALYASTWSYTATHGTEIWRTSTGNTGDWTRVVTGGFNNSTKNAAAISSELFNGYLYVGTYNSTNGGAVWRTNDGTIRTPVNADGFGTANNTGISALAAFNGFLYAGTLGKTSVSGTQLWRCQTCDGSDWTKVVDNGFGNVNTSGLSALEVYGNHLYFVLGNYTSGMQVWRSMNGTNWERDLTNFTPSGQYNGGPYGDNSVIVFNNRLYIGTTTDIRGQGGNIWASLFNLYLPMVIR